MGLVRKGRCTQFRDASEGIDLVGDQVARIAQGGPDVAGGIAHGGLEAVRVEVRVVDRGGNLTPEYSGLIDFVAMDATLPPAGTSFSRRGGVLVFDDDVS